MSAVISQTSALPQRAAATEAAPELILQPGTVIDARVLAVRENLARILIAGLAIEALTEVSLQPGADLKLSVSQTADGHVRLAVVPQHAATQGPASAPAPSGSALGAANPATTGIGAAAQMALPRVAASSLAPASPQALAVSQAVQASASRQASLAPLFANLPVIVAAEGVPRPVRAAASQLLATRPRLDGTLTADDLRQAFQKSGLFLEATLARGAPPVSAPDLKGALVVFRQVLTNWLGQAGPTTQTLPGTSQSGAPAVSGTSPLLPQAIAPAAVPLAQAGNGPVALLHVPAPSADRALANAPAVRPQVVGDAVEGPLDGQTRAFASTPPQSVLPRPSGEFMSATAQALARDATRPLRAPAAEQVADQVARPSSHLPGQTAAGGHRSEPAPPFRGGLPSPQPIAAPSVEAGAAPAGMGRQLLEQTDAALARQTLLQVASLPDRPELGGANQSTQPRWSFEIPFATPQGTAVAQFEIERDGDNDIETVASSRVWRARFSLDVEPAGPVHVLVSLIGETTAVRMWAERPETAEQLRANADALGHALRQADLQPGDILVGEGAPLQPKQRAGHFLDRAT